jgi:hypothetical protein
VAAPLKWAYCQVTSPQVVAVSASQHLCSHVVVARSIDSHDRRFGPLSRKSQHHSIVRSPEAEINDHPRHAPAGDRSFAEVPRWEVFCIRGLVGAAVKLLEVSESLACKLGVASVFLTDLQ